jgi:hypothetical protein
VRPSVQPGGLDDERRATEVGPSKQTKEHYEKDGDDQGRPAEGGCGHGTIVPFSRIRWLE